MSSALLQLDKVTIRFGGPYGGIGSGFADR